MPDTYSTMIRSIHGPKIRMATNTAMIFGIKASVCSCMDVVAGRPHRPTSPHPLTQLYLKLTIKDRIKSCQPSTMTNSNILNGIEIMTGGSIIMPMPISVLATIMSMTINGI